MDTIKKPSNPKKNTIQSAKNYQKSKTTTIKQVKKMTIKPRGKPDPQRNRKLNNEQVNKQISGFNEWEKKKNEHIQKMIKEKEDKEKKEIERPKPKIKRNKNEPSIFDKLYSKDIRSRYEKDVVLDKVAKNEFKMKKTILLANTDYFKSNKATKRNKSAQKRKLEEDDYKFLFNNTSENVNNYDLADHEENELRNRLFKNMKPIKRKNHSTETRNQRKSED